MKMISQKMKQLTVLLEFAATGAISPSQATFRVAHRVALDLQKQILALEQAQIPRRQRLHDDHLASGKVVMLGIVPRIEGVRP
jgi:hypothetical protein